MSASNLSSTHKSISSIEPLEARIAPAGIHNLVVATNGMSATYTDGDGDLVTVKVTKGALVSGLFTWAAGPIGSDLAILDLSSSTFKDANVSITAKPTKIAGDAQAHVGFINSTNHDLGAVTIAGDLSGLIVGDTIGVDLKSLTVNSIGVVNVAGALAPGVPLLNVVGTLGKLTVKGDINGAKVRMVNATSIVVGGSLVGGALDQSGVLEIVGNCGSLKMGGSFLGGGGVSSGVLSVGGLLGPVSIAGSIIGGIGAGSGEISALNGTAVGDVKIGGNLIGGVGDRSGSIIAGFKTAQIGGSVIGGQGLVSGAIQPFANSKIIIGRDMIGGTGQQSGGITSTQAVSAITLGGSLVGGAGTASGSIFVSVLDGLPNSAGTTGPITIGGDIRGGSGGTTGFIWSQFGSLGAITVKGSALGNTEAFSGAILAAGNLGAIKIGGDIRGNTANNFFIRAVGTITSLDVGGSVTSTQILAGFELNNAGVASNAQIGNVTVGRDWITSSISAGIAAGGDNKFGTSDDFRLAPNFSSKIASITVKGSIYGTQGGTDNYGFVAHEIGVMKVGGGKVTLAATIDVVNVATVTGDVFLREV